MRERAANTRTVAELGQWRGGSTPSKAVPAFWTPAHVPWVSPKDMASDHIAGSEDWISPVGAARLTIFGPGSTAVVFRSGILRHRLPVALGSVPFTVNQDLKVLSPAKDVDPAFSFHVIRGIADRVVSSAVKSGTTVESVDPSLFFAMRVFVPPVPEQRQIAEILDALDQAIRKTEAIIAMLKQAKQGLLHDLLTRGIDDNGQLRDPERHPEQFKDSPLGRIPKEWEVHRLHEIAEVRSGIAKNSNRVVRDAQRVPYLRVANVQDGFLDLSDMAEIEISRADLDRYRVLPGDVLMNEGGDLDKLGRGVLWRGEYDPCAHQNHVFVVRSSPRIAPWFLDAWTGSASARRYFMMAGKQTTNLASINKTALGRLPVVVPSVREQSTIAEAIAAHQHRADSEIHELAKLSLVKRGLMEDLLTGRVRVTSLIKDAAE